MRKVLLALCLSLISWAAFAAAQSGGFGFSVDFIPTVQNAAYSSGNSLGGLQKVPFFSGTVTPSGILNNIAVWSKGGSTTAMTLYIFESLPSASTTCTDKSAFVLAAGDIAKLIETIPPVLTPALVGTGTTATAASQQLPVATNNGDSPFTNFLYVCIVAGGTVTPASTTDLVFSFAGTQD